MSERNDGGPAFPVPSHPSEMVESYGMSLRDYFAAKAMQGMLASGGDHFDGQGDPERFSKNAYAYADAMLQAREAK
jgi:hypothetical protein